MQSILFQTLLVIGSLAVIVFIVRKATIKDYDGESVMMWAGTGMITEGLFFVVCAFFISVIHFMFFTTPLPHETPEAKVILELMFYGIFTIIPFLAGLVGWGGHGIGLISSLLLGYYSYWLIK